MLEVLKETTGEDKGWTYQPHIYYVDKKTGKLVAFAAAPNYTQIDRYSKPKKFDKRLRKFEKLGEVENV